VYEESVPIMLDTEAMGRVALLVEAANPLSQRGVLGDE